MCFFGFLSPSDQSDLILLVEGSSFKFTFGLTKAKLILEDLKETEDVLNEHYEEKEEE